MMRSKQQNGFTLLEIIIAVGIFAVLSALAYGGLNSIMKTGQHTREVSKKLQDLELAMSIIQQDLSQVAFRPVTNSFGQEDPALHTPEDLETLLSFTRRGWKNPARQTRSTLQRVSYRLEDNELIRQYSFHLDQAPNTEPRRVLLQANVTDVKLRFLDDKKQWQEIWPTLSMTQKPVPLPTAVELTLVTENWGEITRLFPL